MRDFIKRWWCSEAKGLHHWHHNGAATFITRRCARGEYQDVYWCCFCMKEKFKKIKGLAI